MVDTSNDAPATPRKSGGALRVFGFLFKTTLGCAAFSLGSLVALILLLPSLSSSTVAGVAEDQFAKMYMGRLEIEKLDLAWFGEQRVEKVVLSDPDGREVARCSASGPSIVDILKSGGMRLGRVEVEFQADLIADDQGVSNLSRALEPRDALHPTSPPDPEDEGQSLSKTLAELDVDLVLRVPRVSWSDRDTRAAGTPVEVRDFQATLAVHPGRGMQLAASGKQFSDPPGEIAIDATVDGASSPGAAWPIGPVDARAKLHGLSSALIDGILRCNGDLRDALGPRFDLDLVLTKATPESGDIRVDLVAEHAKVALAGRIEGGELRSGAEPFFSLTATAPRGIVQRLAGGSLPSGVQLSVAPDARPWEVRITNVILPLPQGADRSASAWLAGVPSWAGKIDLDLPGELAVELEPATGASTPAVRAGISGTHLRVRAAPGQPWTVGLESELTGASTGRLKLDCSVADVASALNQGALPRGDLSMHVTGVSTAAIDALLALPTKLAPALGPELAVDVTAREFSADGGSLALDVRAERAEVHAEARVEGGQLRGAGERALFVKLDGVDLAANSMLAGVALPLEIAPGALEITFDELSVPIATQPGASQKLADAVQQGLAFHVRCKLPGARAIDERLSKAQSRMAVRGIAVDARLASGSALAIDLSADLDTGVPGRLAVDAKVEKPWSWLGVQSMADAAPIDAKVTLDRLSTASLDAFADQGGRIVAALGPEIACTIEARELNWNTGRVHTELQSSALSVVFAGEIERGTLKARGADGLSVTWRATPSFVAREMGAHLPEEAKLDWPSPQGDVTLMVREVAFPLPQGSARATGAGLLEGARAEVELKLARLGYSDRKMRAAKLEVDVRDLVLRLAIAPGEPAKLATSATIGMGTPAELAADVSIKEPWKLLAASDARAGANWSADAHLKLSAVSTAWLGAWLDQESTLTTILGSTFDVDLESAGATANGARLQAAVKSPLLNAEFAGDVSAERIQCAASDGLKLTLATSAFEKLAAAHLPTGAKLAFIDAKEPLRLSVTDVQVRLPRSTATGPNGVTVVEAAAPVAEQGLLSSLNLRLKADVPPFEYRDAMTETAQKPVVVRGMSCTADVLPSAPPSFALTASIEDQLPGDIRARVTALQSLRELSDTSDLSALSVALDVTCRQVPTAWIDALAAQEGLLVDTLGPRIELTAKSAAISTQAGQFTADLSSEKAKVHCEGGFADGALTIQKADGLRAQFGLTPMASERVVGKLMPMLFELQKPTGAEPVLLSVDQLSFPMSGDLSQLDAIVRLNLGEVTYKLLPGLETLLGAAAGAKTTRIAPLRVPIEKGVARYDALPVRVGGRDYTLKGSFNLVDQSMFFATEIPLSALGKSVNEKLDALRGSLDPEMKVPIEIRGTWKKPRVAIGDEFLKRVLSDAASNQLEGFLKDALGGKKKKKN